MYKHLHAHVCMRKKLNKVFKWQGTHGIVVAFKGFIFSKKKQQGHQHVQ